ncbi:MAG: ParA family protein [Cyanobacteria bacterium P01_D01_bin.115]
MARVISFFNQAGGTGKTTLAMNVGYALAVRGHRVLLVDMDPQSSLTVFMGLQPHELEATIAQSLLDKAPVSLQTNVHGMDLLPSNLALSAADVRLATVIAKETRLKKAIAPLLSDYDFILVDCPPTLGVLSLLSLVASTHILIPMQTQFKSFIGLDLLLGTVSELQQEGVAPDLKISGVIPNLHDRTSQSRDILEAVTEQFSDIAPVLEPVPRAVAFADASMQNVPLAVYDPKHPVVAVLDEISQQLETF